jgi:hypothetical protein
VSNEFVVAERSALQGLPVEPGRPTVDGVSPELGEKGFGAVVEGAVGGTFHYVVVIVDAHTDMSQWDKCEVEVGHATHGVVEMGRVKNGNEGSGRGGNQRIGE